MYLDAWCETRCHWLGLAKLRVGPARLRPVGYLDIQLSSLRQTTTAFLLNNVLVCMDVMSLSHERIRL